MSKIINLFVGDVRRMFSNIVSVIVVIGLTAIPAVFTWFNVAASWDPFSYTGNLKFAVASEDEGYSSDLMPVKITVGDTVLSTLRANSQLDWTFTTADQAIEGTKSGEYYAAVVIPKDFSRNMMTFFTDNAEHATISYYFNDKKNALAPKVTGQGADQVSAQVNQVFAQTIGNVALSLAEGLVNQMSQPEAQQRLTTFNDNVASLADDLDSLGATIDAYDGLLTAAGTLMDSSVTLLGQASDAATSVTDGVDTAKSSASDITSALTAAAGTLTDALNASSSSFAAVGTSIDQLYASAGKQADDTAAAIRNQAGNVDAQVGEYRALRDALNTAIGRLPADVQPLAQPLLAKIDLTIGRLEALRDGLNAAADAVAEGKATAEQGRQDVRDLATQASQSVADLKSSYEDSLKPRLDQLASTVNDAATALQGTSGNLDQAIGDLTDAAGSASATLTDIRTTLTDVKTKLSEASGALHDFSDKLGGALAGGDMAQVKDLLASASSPEELAATLATPVALQRNAVFPVANFGSSMAPFYSVISLWVGALLICVTLKPTVSRRVRRELGNPTAGQMYLGHYGIFGLIGLMQSTFLNGGSLLFMHVQSVHPWAYMLSGWVASLVFTFFVYTMLASFGNVGKAIGVIVLIVQVSGANGAYPLQVLPALFRYVSPFLPATHAISAFRASVAGIFEGDLWRSLGAMLLFIPPLLLLGLVLRKPLIRFNTWYVAKVESTKLL
ncbi:phage infection protein [Bifidobacterium sp. DSM 109958]|uniref:Phage infection protein n=1 Tax=Bifidobacterium moraviense TaxID=2675323 RepID=A0A7Y0F1Z9_9BIFI|nr:YhgE/Pip domain-containing protein [Bifidobacterium sp. DSM 109958]NMN00541.1 phage infection protein [Bifidobacterium sp. DSM 109958]